MHPIQSMQTPVIKTYVPGQIQDKLLAPSIFGNSHYKQLPVGDTAIHQVISVQPYFTNTPFEHLHLTRVASNTVLTIQPKP